MKNPMVLIRCLTATVLFLMLAKVNVWADTQTHLTLAVGYRALLLAAPIFIFFGMSFGMRASLAVGALASVTMFFSLNSITIGLFALSVAVSGYICKYVNAQSIKGAADNKVSLNVGSLFSGLLLMFVSGRESLLILSAVMMLACLYFSYKLNWNELFKNELPSKAIKRKKNIQFLPLLGWALIGIATGIKLTGIFTILPQYLIHKYNTLPYWYGSMVVLNSLGVIFFQHRILKFLDATHSRWTLIIAVATMALLAMPSVMSVHLLPSAVLWISLLTAGECALSRYDKFASDDGYLFPKEIMVGVGSFLTVFLSREFGEFMYLSGLVGFFCMLLGAALIYLNKITNMGLGSRSKRRQPTGGFAVEHMIANNT